MFLMRYRPMPKACSLCHRGISTSCGERSTSRELSSKSTIWVGLSPKNRWQVRHFPYNLNQFGINLQRAIELLLYLKVDFAQTKK
jgi:hypothetical protein